MRNWICINEKGRRAFVSRNVEIGGTQGSDWNESVMGL